MDARGIETSSQVGIENGMDAVDNSWSISYKVNLMSTM
jgi:hypothetical protein